MVQGCALAAGALATFGWGAFAMGQWRVAAFGARAHSGRDCADAPVLVLVDLKLPRVAGLEVLRRIRADPRTRRIPVVILTSSTETQDLATGYDLGTNSYIRKPVDFIQFAEVVRQLGLYWLVINEPAPRV